MKKLVAIGVVLAVALALALSFALPAAATTTGTGTGVTVTSGESDPPLIKAKWEVLQGVADMEDGDPTHIIGPDADISCPGCGTLSDCRAQFLASGEFEVDKTVQYWVMVKDPNGADNIANVYVRVFHPHVGEGCPPVDGSEKYELRLTEKDKGLTYDGEGNVTGHTANGAIGKFLAAYEAGLVTFTDLTDPRTGLPVVDDPVAGPTPEEMDEIMYELYKCDARIYMVSGPLHYHQPCGKYTVKAKAVDKMGVWATPLYNCFEYICLQAFRIDFNSVSFGNVNLCSTQWIWGDTVFNTPVGAAPSPNPATVHNVGNMPMRLKIAQTDMGLGFTGLSGTTYSGSTPPNPGQTTWNVYFDARLGSNENDARYFDPYDPDDPNTPDPIFTELPTRLMPCTPQELDLSIHIIKAEEGLHSGTMTLECVEAEWACSPPAPGEEPWPWPTPYWPP
jgi:hypothetical protein